VQQSVVSCLYTKESCGGFWCLGLAFLESLGFGFERQGIFESWLRAVEVKF
jgi:hypothetical protein